jgi:post-segregation antitoxin (ccd killing protein)
MKIILSFIDEKWFSYPKKPQYYTSRHKIILLIQKEVLEKAHDLGINVSKACENALNIYIQR